jgi:hypothetical protein
MPPVVQAKETKKAETKPEAKQESKVLSIKRTDDAFLELPTHLVKRLNEDRRTARGSYPS